MPPWDEMSVEPPSVRLLWIAAGEIAIPQPATTAAEARRAALGEDPVARLLPHRKIQIKMKGPARRVSGRTREVSPRSAPASAHRCRPPARAAATSASIEPRRSVSADVEDI